MAKVYNPALSEEPRDQAMKVIPPNQRESLLTWLESAGRLKASEHDGYQDYRMPEELDDFLEPEVYPSDEDEDPLED
jgi:Protein of unknown function (DUF3134)